MSQYFEGKTAFSERNGPDSLSMYSYRTIFMDVKEPNGFDHGLTITDIIEYDDSSATWTKFVTEAKLP